MWTYIKQIPNIEIYAFCFLALILILGISYFKGYTKVLRITGYIFMIIYFLFFFSIFFYPTLRNTNSYNIKIWEILQPVPFRTILNLGVLHIIGNVGVMIPIPLCLYFITKFSVKKIAGWSILIGVFIEPVQLLIDFGTRAPNFVVDIDDFILQEMGIVIGVMMIKLHYLRNSAK